jgi:hypothetical protein
MKYKPKNEQTLDWILYIYVLEVFSTHNICVQKIQTYE